MNARRARETHRRQQAETERLLAGADRATPALIGRRVDPAARVCDWCGDSWPRWRFRCADFTLHADDDRKLIFLGPWAACEVCRTLIEADRWADLLDRSMTEYLSRRPEVRHLDGLLRSELSAAWAGFRAHRDGSPEPRP